MGKEESNIPKIIHYCWFGNGPKTALVKKCIKSWKKYLPDYKIREWNDKDLKNCHNAYVQEAYKAKKWAFITDYFRLYALYNFGGIYFDSDNEVFKSFDEFLNLDFFSGYENYLGYISPFTAVVGAKKGNKIIKELLDEYDDLHFINPDGSLNQYTNTARVTDYFKKKYNFIEPYDENYTKTLEEGCIIYPSNVFCKYEKGISYAVHHFSGSWDSNKQQAPKREFKLRDIFSVYNQDGHKVWNIFGIKMKFKNYKKICKQLDRELFDTKNKLFNVQSQLEYLKEHSDITKLKPATGELREQQLKLVEFAKDFFEEIKEIDIKPFLIAGNLIGHIRHNGFVPWDDDLDFGLIRPDYEKLIEFCKKNFNIEIYNESIYEYNEKQFKKYLCEKYPDKLVLTIWHDQLQVFKGTASGNFIYLDFFPFDYVDNNYSFEEHKKYLNELKNKKNEIKNNKQIIDFLNIERENNKNFVSNSDFLYYGIDNMDSWLTYDLNSSFIPKDAIYPLKIINFEELNCYAPNKPEEYLKYAFKDFMDYPPDIGVEKHNCYLKS